ncbi:hypothetical protein B0H11DRAFT_2221118 [Mycena galericulata]|nr:hypothetical protein B0H11DRAFT_2221118 [Mycena galericulata]
MDQDYFPSPGYTGLAPMTDGITQEISCTVAVISGAAPDSLPATHMLGQMLIVKDFLAKRAGVLSVTAPTLVALIPDTVASSPDAPSFLKSVLQSPIAVALATSRVPFFKEDWKATSYGFRTLPSLNPDAAMFAIPQDTIQPYSEVFAVDIAHPVTVDYMRLWEVMGIKPGTHFILAFWDPLHQLPPPASRFSSPAPHLRLPSPVPSIHTSSGHTRHSSHTSFSQPASDYAHSPMMEVPPINFEDCLSSSTTFRDACRFLGLSDGDIICAIFADANSQSKQLVAMVQNWTAAAHILAKFCISPENPVHTFSGGFKATLDLILAELKWSKASYTKKNNWYRWAAHAATLFWPRANFPVAGDSDFDLYMNWRAICFIWQAGGPAATGSVMSKDSTDPFEKAASGFTQQCIEKVKVRLTNLLVMVDPAAEVAAVQA